MSVPRLVALLLTLATLVIYLPVARNDFISYDDDDYITYNPVVKQGLTPAGVKWAFTTFHARNYHPLTWISHMADCQLFGLNPTAHHLVNALFHAANTALLFLLLWRLTGLIPPAMVVAALFGWHPLHVESVAWAAERKDVLSTFLALLALLSYVKFARQKNWRCYWLALLFFALGLLAKPMLVTLPFVFFLLDFWPLQRLTWKPVPWTVIREKIPFITLSAISCIITPLAQRQAMIPLESFPVQLRLENSVASLVRYLMKLAWPTDLSLIYLPGPIPGAFLALALALLILISAAAWRARERHPCWLFGWLWYVGTLVPVIGLVQVGYTAMADRYSYIPSIGVFVAVAYGLYEIQAVRRYFLVAAAVPLIACVVLTEIQIPCWRDSETVFRHVVKVTENNQLGMAQLGLALELENRYAEALDEFQAVLAINPAYMDVHSAAGDMLLKLGQPERALEQYRICLTNASSQPALHNAAAKALAAAGNFRDAFGEFAEAERLDPHFSGTHLAKAKIFFARGDDTRASAEMQAAGFADPGNVLTLTTIAHYLAATTNTMIRDGNSAVLLATKANKLSGGSDPEVFDVLGMAYAARGDFANAVAGAQNALEFLSPDQTNEITAVGHRLELYQNHQAWEESFRTTNGLPVW